MTLEECAGAIGHKVTYRDHGRTEDGVIASANHRFAFVRYGGDEHARATDPEALALQLSLDEAVALLPSEGRIHTFTNPAGMLLGADWDREKILDLLRTGRPELSGEQATASGHGIVAFRGNDPVFIETRRPA